MTRFVSVASTFLGLLCCGCGGHGNPVDIGGGDEGGSSLLRLHSHLSTVYTKLGRPPKSLQEFKAQLKDVTGLDDMLVSKNDGKPYIIIWGVKPIAPEGQKGPAYVVLAYEQVGVDGKRWVLFDSGVRKQTEAEFQDANFPPGHKPAAGGTSG